MQVTEAHSSNRPPAPLATITFNQKRKTGGFCPLWTKAACELGTPGMHHFRKLCLLFCQRVTSAQAMLGCNIILPPWALPQPVRGPLRLVKGAARQIKLSHSGRQSSKPGYFGCARSHHGIAEAGSDGP